MEGEWQGKQAAMAHLTPKERQLYTEVFLSMDTSGDGSLSIQELTEGCRRLGFQMTDDEARASFSAIDTDQNGKVTLDEFLAVMGHIETTQPRAKKEAKLRRSFRKMDTDGDGVLSEKELMEGLRDAGYNISREQARKLVADLDRDGNGKLNFEEFIRMFDIE